jgi:hypothetical protein
MEEKEEPRARQTMREDDRTTPGNGGKDHLAEKLLDVHVKQSEAANDELRGISGASSVNLVSSSRILCTGR